MGILVYGPDTFTVGADQDLEAYNTDWVNKPTIGAAVEHLIVVAATDDLRDQGGASNFSAAIWKKSLFRDQKIVGDIFTGPGNGASVGFLARCVGPDSGYIALWRADIGQIEIRSETGVLGANTIALGGTVAINTTYTGCYFKVTGINPTTIEAGDNTNGPAAVFVIDDGNILITDEPAKTFPEWRSGYPGLSIYSVTASAESIDNVSIYDETDYSQSRKRMPKRFLDSDDDGRWPELNIKEWF